MVGALRRDAAVVPCHAPKLGAPCLASETWVRTEHRTALSPLQPTQQPKSAAKASQPNRTPSRTEDSRPLNSGERWALFDQLRLSQQPAFAEHGGPVSFLCARLFQLEHTLGSLKHQTGLLTFFDEFPDRGIPGMQKPLRIIRGTVAESKPYNLRRDASLPTAMREVGILRHDR